MKITFSNIDKEHIRQALAANDLNASAVNIRTVANAVGAAFVQQLPEEVDHLIVCLADDGALTTTTAAEFDV